MSALDLAASTRAFAALGDPTRLGMLARLGEDGAMSTASLAARAGISRQGATKHLGVLAASGLVTSERDGRDRRWRIEPREIAALAEALDRASTRWSSALERLRAHVEQPAADESATSRRN